MNTNNLSPKVTPPYKKLLVSAFLGMMVGVIISMASLLVIARFFHASPVGIVNSNPGWDGWQQERYKFGMNKHETPQPADVNSPLISEGTIIMAGNDKMMRWGLHAFEAYAKDGKSRITMLLNKHEEEGRPLAELYYYGTAYNHHNEAYNWFKLGSDVKEHSYMFARDKAISFGSHDFRSVIELAAISPSKDIDTRYKTVEEIDSIYEPDSKAHENARCILYLALRDARDGAMFYNKDTRRIVCKVNGKWQNVVTEDAKLGF